MDEYPGKDNYGKPKSEYIKKIQNMTKEQLMNETEQKIWLSAYASNNPKSDYHWRVDVCYDEWMDREGNSDSYAMAWKRAAGQ